MTKYDSINSCLCKECTMWKISKNSIILTFKFVTVTESRAKLRFKSIEIFICTKCATCNWDAFGRYKVNFSIFERMYVQKYTVVSANTILRSTFPTGNFLAAMKCKENWLKVFHLFARFRKKIYFPVTKYVHTYIHTYVCLRLPGVCWLIQPRLISDHV